MQAATAPALAAFEAYARVFQALDPWAVAEHFHEPALMISPDGVTAAADRAAVARAYARVMARLPAQGYVRTHFSRLHARLLADDLAQVSGAGAWKTATGADLSHFGLTYTLRRVDARWRIVVAAIHAA